MLSETSRSPRGRRRASFLKVNDNDKRLIALTTAAAIAVLSMAKAEACTSMIFKAEDGTRIYARTMEWGPPTSNPR